jgi:uncharacterized protein (DUF1778 family)
VLSKSRPFASFPIRKPHDVRLGFRVDEALLNLAREKAEAAKETLSNYLRGAYECAYHDIALALKDADEVTNRTLGKLAGQLNTTKYVFKHTIRKPEVLPLIMGDTHKHPHKDDSTGNPVLTMRVHKDEKRAIDLAAAFFALDRPHFTAQAVRRRIELGVEQKYHRTTAADLNRLLDDVTVIEALDFKQVINKKVEGILT